MPSADEQRLCVCVRVCVTHAGVYIPILPNDERYTAILDAPVPFMVGLPSDPRASAQSVDLSANDGGWVGAWVDGVL